jgi:hypothetical protein
MKDGSLLSVNSRHVFRLKIYNDYHALQLPLLVTSSHEVSSAR